MDDPKRAQRARTRRMPCTLCMYALHARFTYFRKCVAFLYVSINAIKNHHALLFFQCLLVRTLILNQQFSYERSKQFADFSHVKM